MGFVDKVLVGGGAVVAGTVARYLYKDFQETRRRRASPLSFTDGITQSQFVDIAEALGRRTARVHRVVVDGMTVTLHVKSNTGLSTWSAELDFNDYGHLTGAYWLSTENTQSIIPKHFADALQEQVRSRVSSPS